jgi:antitoxin ParD1/3/4
MPALQPKRLARGFVEVVIALTCRVHVRPLMRNPLTLWRRAATVRGRLLSGNVMTIHLTPDLEQLIQSKIKSGRYNSASEMVREALQLLVQRDEFFTRHKEQIREQIEEGCQSAERGELVNGDEVFDRIDKELEAMDHSAPK